MLCAAPEFFLCTNLRKQNLFEATGAAGTA
jgi:hypothetical protein